YYGLGDYERALEFCLRALSLAESAGESRYIAASLGSLGAIYRRQGDYVAALHFLERSRKQRESMKALPAVSFALIEIASLYQDQGNYEQAVHYLQTALDLARRIGQDLYAAEAHN